MEKIQVSRIGRVLRDFLPLGNNLPLLRAEWGVSCLYLTAEHSGDPTRHEATEHGDEGASAQTDQGLVLN